MQDTFFVRDLETMRVLSDPRRVEILGLLQKPRTTRQVADVLGETANAMYYHIVELEKFRLIRLVKTAMKGHMQEKYYQAAARFYVPAAGLFKSRFDPYNSESLASLQNAQEAAFTELHRASVDPRYEDRLDQSIHILQKPLALPPERQAEFLQRLDALAREFESEQSRGEQALLTVCLIPISGRSSGGND